MGITANILQGQSLTPQSSYETEIVEGYLVTAPNGNELWVKIIQPRSDLYPGQSFPAVVDVSGGLGFGENSSLQLARDGFVEFHFNPEGRGRDHPSEGEEDYNGFIHQDDLKAVIEFACSRPNVIQDNIGVMTHSFGITIGAGCLGRYPELPVKYLIDVEGPSESFVTCHEPWSLDEDPANDKIDIAFNNFGHVSTYRDPSPENVAFWEKREATRFIGNIRCRYMRLQAEWDHAQPPNAQYPVFDYPPLWYQCKHGVDMVNLATEGASPWTRMNVESLGNPIDAMYSFENPPIYYPGFLRDNEAAQQLAVKGMAAMPPLDDLPDDSILNSPFGFHPAVVSRPGYPHNGYVDATNIGIIWTREGLYAFWFLVQPDLGVPDYDFTLYDQQWSAVPTEMRILGNIAPQGSRDEGRCLPGSWLPVDEAQYVTFVKATVERYDGDGVDDMPGLSNPITYWQVGNEPNDHVQSDFAQLQRMTYQAIKEVCPQCQVLIGGATGFPMNYVQDFDEFYAPILTELDGQYVDVFDFHWYGTADGEYRLMDTSTGHDVLSHIHSTLGSYGFPEDLPIWITEMGSYSGDPADFGKHALPLQTERQQASDYFKRFISPLSRGVKKIFPAFGLMEGFKYDDGYFDHTGLIYDGEDFAKGNDPASGGDPGLGVKKLAYYTIKKMTEKLEGCDWENIRILETGIENAYAYRFHRDEIPVWVVWWDYFLDPDYEAGDSIQVHFTNGMSSRVVATNVVPRYSSGSEVSDYSMAFFMDTLNVYMGNVFVPVGKDPVIIEVLQDPPEEKGDMNRDGFINIIDVLRVVRLILHLPPPPTEYELWAADYNSDGRIDILDVVGIVNEILEGGF